MTVDWWEQQWAAYDDATYCAAAACLRPDDIVLDIGAGDLRFAVRAAAAVRHVYAVELQPSLLNRAARPPNLTVVCADARCWPFPQPITVGVLLMRHCTHFALYVARLRAAGCQRLITNARWGVGVECLDLAPRPPLGVLQQQRYSGWYACLCGQIGFWADDPASLSPAALQRAQDVEGCPACQQQSSTITRW